MSGDQPQLAAACALARDQQLMAEAEWDRAATLIEYSLRLAGKAHSQVGVRLHALIALCEMCSDGRPTTFVRPPSPLSSNIWSRHLYILGVRGRLPRWMRPRSQPEANRSRGRQAGSYLLWLDGYSSTCEITHSEDKFIAPSMSQYVDRRRASRQTVSQTPPHW